MIELNDDWVLCKSTDKHYKGYFHIDNIPADYTINDKVMIPAEDFIKHLDLIDADFSSAWSQTIEYFKQLHKSECEFEDIQLSRESFRDYVISALMNDTDRITVDYGCEYEDWHYINSLLNMREFFFVGGDNSYCVDSVLSELTLPNILELQEYSTKQLTYYTAGESCTFTLKY